MPIFGGGVRDHGLLAGLADPDHDHGQLAGLADADVDHALLRLGATALGAADQGIPNNATTVLNFAAPPAGRDPAGYYAAPGMWRVPAGHDGLHLFGFHGALAANIAGFRSPSILFNGGGLVSGPDIVGPTVAQAARRISAMTAAYMVAGDEITFTVYQNSGAVLNFEGATHGARFWIVRLGPTPA